MTNSKSTKRALVTSAFAIVMCLAMFIGTTFAWFTDTATSGVNKIQSGTLDVALEMKNADGEWVSAEGQTLSWKAADNRAQDKILWEPGCTYELQDVRVKNNGNLALKYKIQITGIDGDAKLNEVIEWTVDGADLSTEYHLVAGATSDVLTLQGKMKKEAGNEYQGLTMEGVAITVVATQDTVESDSYDNQYDKNASYSTSVSTAAELQKALATFSAGGAGSNTIELTQDITIADGETWNSVLLDGNQQKTDVTINGNGHKIINLNAPLFWKGFAGNGTLTINNLTIDNPSISMATGDSEGVGAFIGNADSMGAVTLNNCHVTGGSVVNTTEFAGGLIGYSSSPITITNCSVSDCTVTGGGSTGGMIGHLIGASNISGTVTGCTITGDKAAKTGIVLGTANSDGIVIKATGSDNKAGSESLTNMVGRFVADGKTLSVNGHSYTGSIYNDSYSSGKLN